MSSFPIASENFTIALSLAKHSWSKEHRLIGSSKRVYLSLKEIFPSFYSMNTVQVC